MPLTSKHRSALFEAFAPLAGEEAAEAMLSDHPTSDADGPVTKEFLRAELAELRGEFAHLRGGFADLRGEFADLRGEFADLRGELRAEIADCRAELRGEIRAPTVWTVGAVTTILAALITVVELLR